MQIQMYTDGYITWEGFASHEIGKTYPRGMPYYPPDGSTPVLFKYTTCKNGANMRIESNPIYYSTLPVQTPPSITNTDKDAHSFTSRYQGLIGGLAITFLFVTFIINCSRT